jgi:uncharacterized membrane protein (UPF0127 family)
MPWLWCDGRRVGALEVATSVPARVRGLLGRDGIEGALLLRPASSVHTQGMRFPLDVAFCDGQLVVVDVIALGRHRLARPRLRARAVVEAAQGQFGRWGLQPGSQLAIEE